MINVCHVMSADLWAGAEVQVASTVGGLLGQPGVRVSAVLFNHGRLAESLTRRNVPVTIIDEQRRHRLAMVAELVHHFGDHEVDIVHTHRYSDTILATLAAELAGQPRIVRTVHGLREPMHGWAGLRFSAYERLERLALRRRAEAIVAVSRDIADHLVHSGYHPARVRQIHNGIDATTAPVRSRDDVRRELHIPRDAIVLGTAGRLTVVKGHAGLLRAAQFACVQRRDLVWVIAGDGPLRDELQAQAIRLGIADRCRFTGSRGDIHDVIAAMDVFVLSSLHEGIPMALLEAMTLGVPVVAYRVGGVPEVVDHGAAGVLVEPGNEAALADACLDLANRPDERRRLARRAQDTVAGRFSLERSHEAVMNIYVEVAQRPRRRRTFSTIAAGIGAMIIGSASAYRRWITAQARRRARARRLRDAATVAEALPRARRVLILCHGNIIRSAFAARLLAATLYGRDAPTVMSAGLEAIPGRAADPRAIAVAGARGIDLRSHAAMRVSDEQVDGADVLIFVMDVSHLVEMRRRFVRAAHRTFLLTALLPEGPLEIEDPFLGSEQTIERCFDDITLAVHPIARALTSLQIVS